MKMLLKLEELALALLSIYLFSRLPFAWWIYPLLILAPDLSFIGFIAGKRAGMVSYNIFHHKAVAIGLYIAGSLAGAPVAALTGVILLGHGSFDRLFGFGLREFAEREERSRFAPETN